MQLHITNRATGDSVSRPTFCTPKRCNQEAESHERNQPLNFSAHLLYRRPVQPGCLLPDALMALLRQPLIVEVLTDRLRDEGGVLIRLFDRWERHTPVDRLLGGTLVGTAKTQNTESCAL